ncbi:MAG: alpha/beta hydrolase [Oscillospiraceae bacterium]|jgi:pimeloyl-ACP methyl ester carboxylesterase|nr:alpha/beta hydrolase [Oscillospiraceae bacterium]
MKSETKKRVAKILKIIAITLAALTLILVLVVAVGRLINYLKTDIKTENGIQEKRYVRLGGIEQYLYIRGQDKDNPVIIFLHGGPGGEFAYLAYYWQTQLEADYTIINWDQRGSGNTYFRDPAAEKPTIDLLLTDLNDLVDYAREEFKQDKVILVGHSFGTILGAMYSAENPDKVEQYVGVGQAVSLSEGDIISMIAALELAEAQGNAEDAQLLRQGIENETAFTADSDFSAMFETFMQCRALIAKYLPAEGVMSGNRQFLTGLFSPDLWLADMRWIMNVDRLLEVDSDVFAETLAFNQDSLPSSFDVPVTFITGQFDHTTPLSLTERYEASISAPYKNLITLENTGHVPMLDNPELFAELLLNALSAATL